MALHAHHYNVYFTAPDGNAQSLAISLASDWEGLGATDCSHGCCCNPVRRLTEALERTLGIQVASVQRMQSFGIELHGTGTAAAVASNTSAASALEASQLSVGTLSLDGVRVA